MTNRKDDVLTVRNIYPIKILWDVIWDLYPLLHGIWPGCIQVESILCLQMQG
jgi:hypothetical protein